MNRRQAFERIGQLKAQRDYWKSKFYKARVSRERWRRYALELRNQVEALQEEALLASTTRFSTGVFGYASEEARVAARRRTQRDYQRRRRARLKAAA